MWLTRLLLLKELKTPKSIASISIHEKAPIVPAMGLGKCSTAPPAEGLPDDLNSADILFLSARRICRLCGAPADTPLLNAEEGFDIVGAVRVVTNITINADDCYPKFVCSACLMKLKAAYYFRRTCENTDMKFKQMAQPDRHSSAPLSFHRHDFTLLLHQMLRRRAQLRQTKAQRQMKSVTPDKPVKRPVSRFKCVSCDMLFSDLESLTKHRAERACVRRPCLLCRKLVLNLPLHTRRMHRRRAAALSCPACGKTARTSSNLKAHMLMHSTRYDFPCKLCPYRGQRRAYLALHMRRHTGERPYLCAHCPLTFTNASNFRKHSLVHKGKQFQCHKCNKLFRCSKSLQEHDEGYHLKILHPCAVCGKTFTYRSLLLRHERKIHNREKRANPGEAQAAGSEPVATSYERAVGMYVHFGSAMSQRTEAAESTVDQDTGHLETVTLECR